MTHQTPWRKRTFTPIGTRACLSVPYLVKEGTTAGAWRWRAQLADYLVHQPIDVNSPALTIRCNPRIELRPPHEDFRADAIARERMRHIREVSPEFADTQSAVSIAR